MQECIALEVRHDACQQYPIDQGRGLGEGEVVELCSTDEERTVDLGFGRGRCGGSGQGIFK